MKVKRRIFLFLRTAATASLRHPIIIAHKEMNEKEIHLHFMTTS